MQGSHDKRATIGAQCVRPRILLVRLAASSVSDRSKPISRCPVDRFRSSIDDDRWTVYDRRSIIDDRILHFDDRTATKYHPALRKRHACESIMIRDHVETYNTLDPSNMKKRMIVHAKTSNVSTSSIWFRHASLAFNDNFDLLIRCGVSEGDSSSSEVKISSRSLLSDVANSTVVSIR